MSGAFDANVLGPDVLFLIAIAALENRASLENAPNSAPHRAFIAYRPYARLVANEAQRRQLMDAAVSVDHLDLGTVYHLPDGRLHGIGDSPAVIRLDGTLEWFKEGKRFRAGGKPDIVYGENQQKRLVLERYFSDPFVEAVPVSWAFLDLVMEFRNDDEFYLRESHRIVQMMWLHSFDAAQKRARRAQRRARAAAAAVPKAAASFSRASNRTRRSKVWPASDRPHFQR